MQEINRAALVKRASELLSDGTADRVLGWKAGEFDYDITPAVFNSSEELEKDFVWGDFCGANFSKYLIKETQKGEGKVLVFLKPCDTYSFNQLLTEHRFDREKVYAVGIPCDGMLDVTKIKSLADGISSVKSEGNTVKIETLYDGTISEKETISFPTDAFTANPKSTFLTTSFWAMTATYLTADALTKLKK